MEEYPKWILSYIFEALDTSLLKNYNNLSNLGIELDPKKNKAQWWKSMHSVPKNHYL